MCKIADKIKPQSTSEPIRMVVTTERIEKASLHIGFKKRLLMLTAHGMYWHYEASCFGYSPGSNIRLGGPIIITGDVPDYFEEDRI